MHTVLVIGVGSIGERHVRCFQATQRATLAICETDESLGREVAARYGIEHCYVSLEDALAQPHDAAVIATPAHTHVTIAAQLAEAGIAFLMEKPVSSNLDGIDDLLSVTRNKKLIAAVGYTYRAYPAAQAMKDAIDNGRLGSPLQLYATLGQDFAKYRPAYKDIYFAHHEQGGGALQDALTHFLNLGEWFVGPVTRIVADGGHQQLSGVDVEDTVHLMARHGDVMASYALNLFQKANESTLTVVCENGLVRFEVHEARWRWMDETDGVWHDDAHPPPDRDAPYTLQAHAFLDAIEDKRQPLCTLEEGVQTLRVNLAALRSMDNREWMSINAETPDV